MRFIFLTVTVLLLGAIFADGQNTATGGKAKPPANGSDPSKVKKSKVDDDAWKRTWSIVGRFTTTFENNLEHDIKPLPAVGFTPSLTAGYQLRSKHHRIRFTYGIGGSRFTRNTELNLIGHYFGSSYRLSLGRWSWETEAEAIFKGINDDRETNNQFIGSQRLGYRFTPKTRAIAYFAYRIKRYKPSEADRNAVNPMYGIKFSHQFTNRFGAQLGYRYDENRASSFRQNYVRSTYETELKYDLTKKDRLEADISYRQRLYARTVRVGDLRVPRRDQKFSFGLNWQRQISDRYGIELGYGFEKQTSNDPDKPYLSHMVRFSIYYRWGNGEAIEP